jgi:hypothetical protein
LERHYRSVQVISFDLYWQGFFDDNDASSTTIRLDATL